MRKLLTLLTYLPYLALVFGCASEKEAESTKPNIVLFFSDELNPQYISAYGGDIPTPNIDALANNGLRFTQAFTPASMCTPSRYALLTGKYPGRCSDEEFNEAFPDSVPYSIAWNTWISPGETTIARLLSSSGYTTAAVGKWHVGLADKKAEMPDFDFNASLDDPAVNAKLVRMQELTVEGIKKVAGFDIVTHVIGENYDNLPLKDLRVHNFEWMTEGVMGFLEQQKDKENPFFLYLATTGIHGPNHFETLSADVRYTPAGKMEELAGYQAERENKLKEWQDLPSNERHLKSGMWFIDQHVKRIVSKLETLGYLDNTIVLFMADHNVEPGKATCYNRGTHVPFIVHWPAKIQTPGVESALVSSVDILPTLCDVAGVDLPQRYPGDGHSMFPLIEGSVSTIRPNIYSEAGYTRSVFDGKYKYIAFRLPESVLNEMKSGDITYAPNHLNVFKQAHSQIALEGFPGYFDPDQLYDVINDPYEQNNLAMNPDYVNVLDSMKSVLKEQLETFDNSFDLAVDSFMYSQKYQEMVKNTRSIGTDFIEWWHRDHGDMEWPPKE